MKNIQIKKFAQTRTIETNSNGPYVEIEDANKKIVVKKTSLCWVFQKDFHKISSDRLLRVKESIKPTKLAKRKIRWPKPKFFMPNRKY